MKTKSSPSPAPATRKMKAQFRDLVTQLRKEIGTITEPKVQALFETSAEVLNGLIKAFDDCEKKNEAAWRTKSKPAKSKATAKTA